jgi:ribosomal protein S18 acetylase RimI-like enzyme
MAAALAHLADAGLASAGLWVLRDNAPARRFYEALGAAPGPEKAISLLGRHPAVEIAYRFALRRPPSPRGRGSDRMSGVG